MDEFVPQKPRTHTSQQLNITRPLVNNHMKEQNKELSRLTLKCRLSLHSVFHVIDSRTCKNWCHSRKKKSLLSSPIAENATAQEREMRADQTPPYHILCEKRYLAKCQVLQYCERGKKTIILTTTI